MSESVRMTIHFFVNFDIFEWLYLAYFWIYLHQTWGFCKAWSALCEKKVQNMDPWSMDPLSWTGSMDPLFLQQILTK